jgi:hypothetical protein
MQFIRQIASTVTVFHQGAVLVEDHVDAVSPTRPCATSISERRPPDMILEDRMILEVSGLRAGYGDVPVLHGIDFAVKPQEFVGILGHNGMGKSTLLGALMGRIKTREGRVASTARRHEARRPSPLGARHGAGAAGARDLPQPDRAGKPRNRPRHDAPATPSPSSRRRWRISRACAACSTAAAARFRAASSNCWRWRAASAPTRR